MHFCGSYMLFPLTWEQQKRQLSSYLLPGYSYYCASLSLSIVRAIIGIIETEL